MQWGGLGQGGMNPNLPGVQEVRRIRGRLSLVLEDTEFGKVYDQTVVLRLLKYLKPHWKMTLLSMVAMLVYIGTQIAVPVLVGMAINQYMKEGDLSVAERVSGMHRIGLYFAGIVFLNLAGNFIHLRGLARVNMSVLYQLRSDMHAHLQRLSTLFFDHNEVGRLMSRVQNDTTALQEFMTIFVVGFAEVLSLVGIIVVMLRWNLDLALICFVVIPVFGVIMVFWQIRARRSFMRIRYAIAGVNASLQENITGVRVTQSMNREKVNLSQFDELNAEHLNANLNASRLTASLMPTVEVLTAIAFGILIVVGGRMEQSGSLELGTMVAFALLVQRFFEPIRALVMQYAMMQRAMTAGMRIFELLDVQPDLVDKPDAQTLPPIKGHVKFDHVSFSYIPDVQVLDDVSVEIAPGESMAIVGPTGAWKDHDGGPDHPLLRRSSREHCRGRVRPAGHHTLLAGRGPDEPGAPGALPLLHQRCRQHTLRQPGGFPRGHREGDEGPGRTRLHHATAQRLRDGAPRARQHNVFQV